MKCLLSILATSAAKELNLKKILKNTNLCVIQLKSLLLTDVDFPTVKLKLRNLKILAQHERTETEKEETESEVEKIMKDKDKEVKTKECTENLRNS